MDDVGGVMIKAKNDIGELGNLVEQVTSDYGSVPSCASDGIADRLGAVNVTQRQNPCPH